ncbi:MiaB/RimO family radical SAM methylthiotransferase, partial [bacterium]|nr:MiaB/RimO family radical SAM methylthiotransferase [bacterium]
LSFDINDTDYIIINTCSFIEPSMEESYNAIKEAIILKKEGKIERIIVSGCLPERFQGNIAFSNEIDAIRGIDHYNNITEFYNFNKKVLLGKRTELYEKCERALVFGKHYEYLKIAEGCSKHCTYCMIPYIKGKLRSKSKKHIIAEAKKILDAGIRELIIIAQDSSDYGKDRDGKSHLLELLEELDKLGFAWIRVHYLYPDIISKEFVDAIFNMKTVLPYFDIPLQHIDERLLKLMGRKPLSKDFFPLLKYIKKSGGEIRTSFIIGFPSEMPADFEKILNFIKEFALSRVSVFPYYDERNLVNSMSLLPVEKEIVDKRLDLMENMISENIYREFSKGKREKVIIDEEGSGYYLGRTFRDSPDVDLTIKITGKNIHLGNFYRVKLSVKNGELWGRK